MRLSLAFWHFWSNWFKWVIREFFLFNNCILSFIDDFDWRLNWYLGNKILLRELCFLVDCLNFRMSFLFNFYYWELLYNIFNLIFLDWLRIFNDFSNDNFLNWLWWWNLSNRLLNQQSDFMTWINLCLSHFFQYKLFSFSLNLILNS